MGFSVKNWISEADHAGPPASPPGTPISAAALEDMESRLSTYTNNILGAGTNGFKNVKTDYSATGDGSTDDTTAIQNALNAVCPNGETLYFPAGTYNITDELTIPNNSLGFRLLGNGRHTCLIEQQTNNKAIFNFAYENVNSFVISDFQLSWASAQTAQTSSYAFAFTGTGTGVGAYRLTIERLWLENGYIGIGQRGVSTSWPVWGCRLHDWFFASSWKGRAVNLDPYSGGAADVEVSNIYINAQNSTLAYLFNFVGANNLTVRNCEINDASTLGPEFSFTGCRSVVMQNCKTEGGTVGTGFGGNGLVLFDSSTGVIVDGFEVTYKTINTDTYGSVIWTSDGSIVDVRGLIMAFTTYTAGTFDLINNGTGAANWTRLGNYYKDSGSVGVVRAATGQDNVFYEPTPNSRKAHVGNPSGGGTQDAEARTAINSILTTLEDFGFHAKS